MSDSRRVQKVEKELQQVIASYLLSGSFKEPLSGLVSVTHVMVTRDLRSAKVFISVLGSEKEQVENLAALNRRTGDVQREISSRLRMKFCPKVRFVADHSTENVLKVDRILHELRNKAASDS